MIARLSILLPFTISVSADGELPPQEVDQGIYRVRMHPPRLAVLNPADAQATSPVSMDEVLRQLRPVEPQVPSPLVLLNGAPTTQANLLQIDFIKPDFDRRRPPDGAPPRLPSEGDPPPQLGFDLANGLLLRLRSISRGGEIHPIAPTQTHWDLEYLNDDGSQLAPAPAFYRRRAGSSVQWRVAGLNRDVWERVVRLPLDFTPPTWDSLLLDAESMLPDVAAAISLANAALEAFSAWFINTIASLRGLPPGLWEWINERGDWYKEPSVDERFDQLPKILGGRSLKEETKLWQSYKNLRNARNSFSHGGKAIIGKTVVTREMAAEIVEQAGAVIDWCEALLPASARRPERAQEVNFELRKNVVGRVFEQPHAGADGARAE